MTDSASRPAGAALPFELETMAGAVRYQEWMFDRVRPSLGTCILEVGSGIGTMTRWLAAHAPTVATDVDPGLLMRLRECAEGWRKPPIGILHIDLSRDVPEATWAERVDTVVSFNVLEHIDDHVAAVRGMLAVLRASRATGPKRLIVLVPAHQWAYGAIDESFGHCRRYSKRMLADVIRSAGAGHVSMRMRYFNTVGLPGWVVLGRLLRRPSFGRGSVDAMERLVPIVRRIDSLLHGAWDLPLGQSLLCVVECG